jgi:hypothetical protein
MPKELELIVLPSWQTLSLRGIEAFAAEAPPAMDGRLTLVQPDDRDLLDVRVWRAQIQGCFFMTIGARERGVVSAVCDRGWYRPAGGQRSHCFDVHLVHKFGWMGQSGSTLSMRHATFESVHRLATTAPKKRVWLDMLSAAEERFHKHFFGLPVAPVLLSPLAPTLAPLAPPTIPAQKQGSGGGGGGGDVAFSTTASAGSSTLLTYKRSGGDGGAAAAAAGSAISSTAQPKFTLGGGGTAAEAAPRAGSTVSPAAQPARRIYKRLSEQFRERTDAAAERARLAAAKARVVSVDATLRASLAAAEGLTAARTALRDAKAECAAAEAVLARQGRGVKTLPVPRVYAFLTSAGSECTARLVAAKAKLESEGANLRSSLAAAQALTAARAALRNAKAERAAAGATLLAKRAARRTAAAARAATAACAAATTAALAAATATLTADAAIEAAATVARPSADATRMIGSLLITDDIFVGIASFFAFHKYTYSYPRANGERVLIAHQQRMTPQSMDWQMMLAIGGVCRSWRKALASVAAADLWRVLHRPPSDAALQFAIRCAGDGGPTKVFLSGQTMLTDASINALHGKRNLRLLNVRGTTGMTPAAVQALTWSLAQPRMAPRPDRNVEIGAESASWDDQSSHIAFSAASGFGRLITDGGGAWKTQRKLTGLFSQIRRGDLQPVCSECSETIKETECQWFANACFAAAPAAPIDRLHCSPHPPSTVNPKATCAT